MSITFDCEVEKNSIIPAVTPHRSGDYLQQSSFDNRHVRNLVNKKN
ncbi:MAG: hypothetical protein SXA11_09485 [Cyanobacteriota bacterium]|nr:hypothetical protein [Cyanobacteriota bacterium]